MNESGLQLVFQNMRPDLIRYLLARGQTPEDAEDLLQDAYLKLGSHRGGPVQEARAYLYRMVHNLLLDRRRSAVRRLRREQDWTYAETGGLGEMDNRASAEDTLIGRERLEYITAALAKLPDRTQYIFRRFRFDEVTQKAIADEMGLSKSAVEKHIYRAYAVVAAARIELDADRLDTTSSERARLSDMSDDRHG